MVAPQRFSRNGYVLASWNSVKNENGLLFVIQIEWERRGDFSLSFYSSLSLFLSFFPFPTLLRLLLLLPLPLPVSYLSVVDAVTVAGKVDAPRAAHCQIMRYGTFVAGCFFREALEARQRSVLAPRPSFKSLGHWNICRGKILFLLLLTMTSRQFPLRHYSKQLRLHA